MARKPRRRPPVVSVEILAAVVGTEHQRDSTFVREGSGRPVVLDEQEAAVPRLSSKSTE